jgi:ABC-2 type transport system ATP-binding protein
MKTHSAVARLESVTKTYGTVVALGGVSFELRRGEVLSLLGPNGAGKTTAIQVLLGLAEPSSGSVELFGLTPKSRVARMRTGVMLQAGGVPATLRVAEHVELFSSYYEKPMPVAETLAAAGLTGLEKRPFGELSGGQKQRVLFALAICGQPELLFLDEPTVGLDPESRRAIWKQVRLMRAGGTSVLLTTHYLEEAEALSDRVLVIDGGRFITEGTPAEIKEQAQSATLEDAFLKLTHREESYQ